MTSDNFIFWLHGFFEIGKPEKLSAVHVQEIKNHIDLVLKRQTPPTMSAPFFYNPAMTTGNFPVCGPNLMAGSFTGNVPLCGPAIPVSPGFSNHTGWSPFTGDIYFSGNLLFKSKQQELK